MTNQVNRARLAELVRKDLVKFSLNLQAVANAFGHDWPITNWRVIAEGVSNGLQTQREFNKVLPD